MVYSASRNQGGEAGGRKAPEALARLHSGGSLNRSHAFTAEGRGSSAAPPGLASFLDVSILRPSTGGTGGVLASVGSGTDHNKGRRDPERSPS